MVTHFKEQKPTQNHKKFLETWNSSQITLQTFVLLFGVRILTWCPTWLKDMKKFKDLSRKSYLEAWNISVFLKFITINIYDGFFIPFLIKLFVILKPKKSLFFYVLTNQTTMSRLKMKMMISWKAERSALAQTGKR